MTTDSFPPTALRDRHLPRFQILTPPEAQRVVDRVRKKFHGEGHNDGAGCATECGDGEGAFHYCQAVGFDLARVLLSLIQESDEVGRAAIEKLHGRPILAWGPSVEAATEERSRAAPARAPEAGPKRVDSRIVKSVKPNPRRAGSEAHEAYQHWREGDTVQACLERGLTARSVRRDVRHGYVVLEGVDEQ